MRVLIVIALFFAGCSSSSTNNSNDEVGGNGGTGATSSGGGGAIDSGSDGGGLGDASPEATAGAGGREPCFETQIVINELSTYGVSEDDEFLELHNPTAYTVSLVDIQLDLATAEDDFTDLLWTGTPDDYIQPHGFFSIAGVAFGEQHDAVFIGGMSLAESAGVRLWSPTGTIDRVAWGNVVAGHLFLEGNAAPTPANGASIGRTPDGRDCQDNASDFVPMSRTPGGPNAY